MFKKIKQNKLYEVKYICTQRNKISYVSWGRPVAIDEDICMVATTHRVDASQTTTRTPFPSPSLPLPFFLPLSSPSRRVRGSDRGSGMESPVAM